MNTRSDITLPLLPGYCYHIYNRANSDHDVFFNPDNFSYFLKQYARYLDRSFQASLHKMVDLVYSPKPVTPRRTWRFSVLSVEFLSEFAEWSHHQIGQSRGAELVWGRFSRIQGVSWFGCTSLGWVVETCLGVKCSWNSLDLLSFPHWAF